MRLQLALNVRNIEEAVTLTIANSLASSRTNGALDTPTLLSSNRL